MEQETVDKILFGKKGKWKFEPCPFCGHSHISVKDSIIDAKMGGIDEPCTVIKRVWAFCNYCHATGPESTHEVVYNDEVVAAALCSWNKRAKTMEAANDE